MRTDLPANMESVWRGGDYTGLNRPIGRVTVQRPNMRLYTLGMKSTFRRVPASTSDAPTFNPYPSGVNPNKGEPVTNVYADYMFHAPAAPLEFPNVKSISWQRSTDSDVAECTVTFWNTRPLPIGERPKNKDFDQPGFYTFGHGKSAFSSRWGHTPNAYAQLLAPDNILRTYEGYGSDLLDTPGATVPPEDDTHLVLTGVWMIDAVVPDSDGSIRVTCRDMGRLLLDHLAFLPVVPSDFYPLVFDDWGDKVTVQAKKTVVKDTRRRGALPFKLVGSGNDKWPESAYLGADRHGHKLAHAADGKNATYWLSVGNGKSWWRSAYEYVDIEVANLTVEQITVKTVKTGYQAYVSIKQKGKGWMDGKAMPYHRDGRGRYDEDVPYVHTQSLGDTEGPHTIKLNRGKGIENVVLIRLWLGSLPEFSFSGAAYRAGIREIGISGVSGGVTKKKKIDSSQVALTPGPAGSNPGKIQDFSDIIKLACAWAGFYWPADSYVYHSDGTKHTYRPASADKDVLGAKATGRVWGDIQDSGTAPLEELAATNFDKKSLLDVIAYVRDMLGFILFVDESGAVQWRMPNVWDAGNWISGLSANPGRTTRILTIDERQNLMGLTSTIQSRDVRELIFAGNPVGKYATLVGGYNPNQTGLRRVGGYTDGDFASLEEATVMADLIAVRQLFKYRTDRISMPAFPGIQIDDQVRPFERVTSEGFIHYVKGISSTLDTGGQWLYDLQTHWLGDDPDGAWVANKSSLSSVTEAYVDALSDGPTWGRNGLEG